MESNVHREHTWFVTGMLVVKKHIADEFFNPIQLVSTIFTALV